MNNEDNNTTTPVVDLNSSIQIETNEDSLKSDGSVVLGYRNPDNTYSGTNNQLPEQIDIKKRRKEKIDLMYSKRKKAQVNKNTSKEAKKVQSIVAVVVLALFGVVFGVFYYYKNIANNLDFSVKKVTIEFGEPVSLKISDYVYLNNPDEKKFYLDLSEFVPDKIGTYKYKLTHGNVTRVGDISVIDSKAPDVVIQELKVTIGDTYSPEMFIKSCKDYSGCIITFQDGSSIKTAQKEGNDTVYLVVADKQGNKITKQATLNVKSTNKGYNCTKTFEYDYDLGYRKKETYELTFTAKSEYISSELVTELEYINKNDYLDFKNNNNNSKYTYNDNLSTVTYKEPYTSGFSGTSYFDINMQLSQDGYTCSTRSQ